MQQQVPTTDAAPDAPSRKKARWPAWVGIGIVVMWLLLLPAACFYSIDLCDVGGQLNGEAGNNSELSYGQCVDNAHTRQHRAKVALIVAGALTAVGSLAVALSPSGGSPRPAVPTTRPDPSVGTEGGQRGSRR